MHQFDLLNMNLRQIKIFLTAAETQNMVQAAKKLSVTQSAISKSIANLEEKLGVALFIRTKGISLTTAGKTLYSDLDNIMQKIESAFNKVRPTQAKTNQVHLGVIDGLSEQIVYDILAAFRQKQSHIALHLHALNPESLMQKLLIDELDIIITLSPGINDTKASISTRELITQPNYVIMSADHPLAAKSKLTVMDIATEPLFALSPHTIPEYMVYIRQLFAQYGYTPNVYKYGETPNFLLYNLLLGEGIFIALSELWWKKESRDDFFGPNLKAIVLENTNVTAVAAWKTNNKNESIAALADEICEVFAALDKNPSV